MSSRAHFSGCNNDCLVRRASKFGSLSSWFRLSVVSELIMANFHSFLQVDYDLLMEV